MSVTVDKKQPFGQHYTATEAGANGVLFATEGSNVVSVKQFVLDAGDGVKIPHTTTEYFGTNLPFVIQGGGMSTTFLDNYPEAKVGSVYHRFGVNNGEVFLYTMFIKIANNTNGSNNWSSVPA
jgi:hypothetical protein